MRIPRHSRMLTAALVAAAAATAAAAPLLSAGADTAGVYRQGEFDLVRNILPPGQTGFLSATEAAQEKANGTQAPHQSDQLGMYADLVKHAPNITQALVDADYKDASFGVKPGDIASTETPRADVTVIRDRSFGVPHVYGTTDAGTVFGAGWIDAEDRLFLTDVLRHYGRSTLASFLGPDRSFIEMDCAQAQLTGYSEAELDAQIARLPRTPVDFPALAQQYVDGINAYIDATLTDPSKLPAEYLAFGLRPQHFNVGDIVAVAGLVGGIFGKGGGVETHNAQFLRALFTAFGGPTNAQKADPTTAMAIFKDMMESDDPGAPTTVSASFPWENRPQPDPNAYALTRNAPGDPIGTTCSVSPSNVPLVDSATAQRIAAGLQATPHAMSNALLVDGQHSTTGRPIAVFGPQVSYYEPQILVEEDLHGPDFDVRGSSFPGTNFIVELGHGPDYAWSATSAGTDNVDQFAERLCNPSSPDPLQNVDPQSTSYMHDGKCIAMYERTQTELAAPTAETLAGGSPSSNLPRQVTIKIERTVHGPVLDRTTAWVDGREVPVAISSERTTFMHEADSVLGFAYFNDPAYVTNAQDFLKAASQIEYTFNWFYIDDRDIAYYQSGLLPVRAAGVHPDLPTWGTGRWDWQGNWDWSTGSIGDQLDFAHHVQAIDPPGGVMTSWNNKGGVGFRASDDQWSYGDVFRSQSLDAAIASYLGAQHGRMSLVDLVNAMETAASVDLRGAQLLPDVVRLAGGDPSVSGPVATLAGWLRNGAHRRDLNGDGVYDEVKAVELMNALYPRLLHAMFGPSLQTAFAAVPEEFDDAPGPVGSAYIEGWYGYAQKALDQVLGNHVAQPYQALRCADGTVAGCRAAVVAALKDAAAHASTDDRGTTSADDIHFSAVGLGTSYEIPWQNRPTFQQVVDIPGHRPRTGQAVAAAAVSGASVTGLPMTSHAPAGGGVAALLAGAAVAGALRRRRRRAA